MVKFTLTSTTRLLFALLILLQGAVAATKADTARYKDSTLPVKQRVADLLQRMTLQEKITQLTSIWIDKNKIVNEDGSFNVEKAREAIPLGVGHLARPNDRFGEMAPADAFGKELNKDPRQTAVFANAIQKYQIEETRLGIPVLMHEESLHGYQARHATSFPQAVALASSWDPDLIERINVITAREIRARGARQALGPVLDVMREPRWGRSEETFGEDPYLVTELNVAAIKGLQGDKLPLADGKVLATLKHLVGHGQPEGGSNTGPLNVSEHILREVFFPPFEQAIKRTNVMIAMSSFNEVNGIPAPINSWLLKDILRKEWGFNGMVVSDYFSLYDLVHNHKTAANFDEASLQAILGGVDVELPDPIGFPSLIKAVKSGLLAEQVIDRAVERALYVKFQAGLFDQNVYVDPDYAEAITSNAEARALAEEAARRSVVLLKNTKKVLPLDKSKIKRLAVIGPNAAETILGGYSDKPKYTVSLLEGVKNYVGSDIQVDYAEGVRITEGRNWWRDDVVRVDPKDNFKRIAAAVAVAKKADVIILAIGGNEHTAREGWSEKHLGDRSSLDLVGEQQQLADAMLATGKPVVVVLINGQPISITKLAESASTIVEAWYLGQETGTALADVLFGEYNPGGKLPLTIPRSVGQLPIYYNYKPTARRDYLFTTKEPLYYFGYGLSYTTFKIGQPKLSRKKIKAGDSVVVKVRVKNTGKRAGDEVVQLYIRDQLSSVTRPVKELKGFQRVHLKAGQSKTLKFEISREHLQFYNQQMQRVVEPGLFDIMVGNNSKDLNAAVLEVVD